MSYLLRPYSITHTWRSTPGNSSEDVAGIVVDIVDDRSSRESLAALTAGTRVLITHAEMLEELEVEIDYIVQAVPKVLLNWEVILYTFYFHNFRAEIVTINFASLNGLSYTPSSSEFKGHLKTNSSLISSCKFSQKNKFTAKKNNRQSNFYK